VKLLDVNKAKLLTNDKEIVFVSKMLVNKFY